MNPFAKAVPCQRCEDTDYGYAHRQIADTAPSETEMEQRKEAGLS